MSVTTTIRVGPSSRYTRNGDCAVVPTKASLVPSNVAPNTTSVTAVPGPGTGLPAGNSSTPVS